MSSKGCFGNSFHLALAVNRGDVEKCNDDDESLRVIGIQLSVDYLYPVLDIQGHSLYYATICHHIFQGLCTVFALMELFSKLDLCTFFFVNVVEPLETIQLSHL